MGKKHKPVIHRLPEIIERDGGEWVCHYCGRPLIPHGMYDTKQPPYYRFVSYRVTIPQWIDGEGLVETSQLMQQWEMNPEYRLPHADHMQPKSRGGSDDLDNLVASCDLCNARKGKKTYDEFIAYLRSKGELSNG